MALLAPHGTSAMGEVSGWASLREFVRSANAVWAQRSPPRRLRRDERDGETEHARSRSSKPLGHGAASRTNDTRHPRPRTPETGTRKS